MKLLTHAILSMPLIGAYAIFAIGIVVIYRASRVLNLAHSAMAMVPAYVGYTMATAGVPMPIALLAGIVVGALVGTGVERVFIRGLREMSATAQTVGTVAALSLMIALTAKIWGTTPRTAPLVFPKGSVAVGSGILQYGAIGLFVVALVLGGVMLMLFRYTNLGLAMRGAAENRRAASLMGINPDRTSTVAWAIGGGLAALSGILLAAITILEPYRLSLQVLPAFVAALLGGLESLTGALWGSAVVGLVIGLVPATASLPVIGTITSRTGGPELALTILALLVMYFRGQRFSVATREDAGFQARSAARPARSAQSASRKRLGSLAFAVLVLWVWLPGVPFSVLSNVSQAMVFTLVGVSLVVLTGWVGQISLGHAAFVGIGAFGTGLLVRDLGIAFPFNLPLAALLSAGAATLLGAVALRVRGLYLAVATLIFSWMADSFLYRWFVGTGGTSSIDNVTFGAPGGFPNFDLSDRKILYYFGLAVTALGLMTASNIRRSKTGRAFFATKGSEMAAASLGIDVMRYKLLAFGLSGFLAGAAGNLVAIDQRTIVPDNFNFIVSLFYLSIVVVGGLTKLSGVVVSAVLFAALNEVFFRVTALGGYLEVVSAGLLVVALLTQAKGKALARLWERLDRGLARFRPLVGRAASVLAPVNSALSSVGSTARRVVSAPATGVARRISPARDAMRRRLPSLAARRPAAGAAGSSAGSVVQTAIDADVAQPEGLVEMATHPGNATVSPNGGRQPTNPAVPSGWRDRVRRLSRRAAMAVQHIPGPIGRLAVGRINPATASQDAHDDTATLVRGDAPAIEAMATNRSAAPVILEARNVTVRFGGLTAVADASLQVREKEIVGLIGPNGAGKTTMFNAISGLNEPTSGVIRLFGEDASGLPVHERARRGLGRTFQVLQLFSDLSVRDNLLVATHVHNPTGFLRHMLATDEAVRAESEARARIEQIIEALDLREIADRPVAGLPFGMLRLVELGRAVVTQAPIVLLDEPASGLDNTETERFSDYLRSLRSTLGISILIIEHDVRMVTGVSDYMYVLAMGRVIAEGPPEHIKRDPAVIAAYLGESSEPAQPETAGLATASV